MNQNDVITASGLEMRFPGCDALQGIDLTVKSGTVFALLGENGAGKTTMIRILTGFQKPTAGTCRVCGLDPMHDSLQIRRRIGYVSDAPAMYDWMTVSEIGWFTASFYPPGFVEKFLELVGGYEIPTNRKIKVLSKGQRMIVRGFSPEMRQLLAGRNGVNTVKYRAASLEELFVACTRGIGALSRPRDTEPTRFNESNLAEEAFLKKYIMFPNSIHVTLLRKELRQLAPLIVSILLLCIGGYVLIGLIPEHVLRDLFPPGYILLAIPALFSVGAGAMSISQEKEMRTLGWLASLPLSKERLITTKFAASLFAWGGLWLLVALLHLTIDTSGFGPVKYSADFNPEIHPIYSSWLPYWLAHSFFMLACGYLTAWRFGSSMTALVAFVPLALAPSVLEAIRVQSVGPEIVRREAIP